MSIASQKMRPHSDSAPIISVEDTENVEKEAVVSPLMRRAHLQFVWAAALSLVILMGGMVAAWRIGSENAKIYHRLYHTREGLHGLQKRLGLPEADGSN